MKILLAAGIYPPEIGGPATFVPALAAEWTRRGIEVSVVTYGDSQTRSGESWPVTVVSRSGGVFLRYLRYAWRVKRLATCADAVFLQGPFSEGLPGTIGAWLARRPTVLRVPGDFAWEGMQRAHPTSVQSLTAFLDEKKGFPWKLIFALEAWVARRAKAVVTPSVYLQKLSDAWGVQKERQRVIYNTVEVDSVSRTREELRMQFKIEEGTKVLLAVARAAPWKRIDFILQVLKELPREYQLVFLGEGPELHRWKELTKYLGIAERVRFEGRVSRQWVQEWAVAADVFLLPSLYEGFPHVAVEMACAGLPCFLSDQGGNPEAAALYPVQIRILPYADTVAWTSALTTLPARTESIVPEAFSQVAARYLTAIKSVL